MNENRVGHPCRAALLLVPGMTLPCDLRVVSAWHDFATAESWVCVEGARLPQTPAGARLVEYRSVENLDSCCPGET